MAKEPERRDSLTDSWRKQNDCKSEQLNVDSYELPS